MATTYAETLKAYATDLYDVESRPSVVKSVLERAGAAEALHKVGLVNGNADKVIAAFASMTTVAGLMEKKDAAVEFATPYIEKAKDADGRKEIADELAELQMVQDGKAMLTEKVVEPVSAKIAAGKEFAAPYIAKAHDIVDPYVEKLTELRNSERVESMITAFQQAREHPAEEVSKLRSKAVDLIKYETMMEYREHVMSEKFQADTIQLIKVDLPAMVKDATKRGAEGVKAKAEAVKEEIVLYKEKVTAMVPTYKEKVTAMVPTETELKDLASKLKETGSALLAELQVELSSGVDQFKAEGISYDDTIERLKRVVGIVDKMVVTPIIVKAKEAKTAITTTSDADERPIPPTGTVEDDEVMEDALEEVPAEA